MYDDLGQLVGVVCETQDSIYESYNYIYDAAGNIINASMYGYSNLYDYEYNIFLNTYTYSSSDWGDLLTAFNGVAITYDEIGNPLSYYNGATFGWTGRRLTSATYNGGTYAFTYDDNGVRQSKTKDGVTTTYYYDGNTLIAEVTGNEIVVYLYDANGAPVGMQYRNDTYTKNKWDTYWFEKNLQGDILAVYDYTGKCLVQYSYDPWGKVSISYSNDGASTSAAKNSLTYRGYYYDKDLGLYYLISRYYDANTGRFISADGYVSTGQGLTGYNMFAYCGNDPINRVDPEGNLFVDAILGTVLGLAAGFIADPVTTVLLVASTANAATTLPALGNHAENIGIGMSGAVDDKVDEIVGDSTDGNLGTEVAIEKVNIYLNDKYGSSDNSPFINYSDKTIQIKNGDKITRVERLAISNIIAECGYTTRSTQNLAAEWQAHNIATAATFRTVSRVRDVDLDSNFSDNEWFTELATYICLYMGWY